MAGQRSKRRTRKRRRTGSAPRAVPAQRREHGSEREVRAGAQAPSQQPRRTSRIDPRGERPPSPFGGIPVSEVAIFAGFVAFLIGYFDHREAALIGGIILCSLGVIEVTSREHFAGFRSHTILLAAIPTVAVEFLLVQVLPSSWPRETALIGDVIVYSLLFFPLRNRFLRRSRIPR